MRNPKLVHILVCGWTRPKAHYTMSYIIINLYISQAVEILHFLSQWLGLDTVWI